MTARDDYETTIQSHLEPLTAPRVTPDDIQSAIVREEYFFPAGRKMTVCVLTLRNGFQVLGQTSAVNPENFREDLGRQFSRKDAESHVWPLLGYALQEKLSHG